jgi:hypothetical protein
MGLLLLVMIMWCSTDCTFIGPTTTTTGGWMVRAEDDDYNDEETTQDAVIDAMTGESSMVPPSMLHLNNDDDGNMKYFSNNPDERDPNLRLMTYNIGNGEQTTYVYVEPTIEEMYRHSNNVVGEQRVQRVTPQFNGFAGKFINMSNKKCTLYWYVAVVDGTVLFFFR